MGTSLAVGLPQNAALQRGLSALRAGGLNDAADCFKKVLQAEPRNVAALNLLAVTLTQLQKFSDAETYFRLALNEQPNSDATLCNYGLVLKALKRPAEAVNRFTEALQLNGGAAETWNNRGAALNDLKRHDEAVRDFEKAIQLNPRYAEAFCNKGNSLNALARREEALAAFERALALKSDLPEAWLGRAYGLYDKKRYQEAIAAFERALSLNQNLAEAWLGGGNAASALGRYVEALSAYDRALALNPDLAEAKLGRGNVLAEQGRQDDALTAYDDALVLKPDLAEAWLGRGNILTDAKRYDEASATYDQALALKLDLASAWYGRGNVLAAQKRYDDAFAAYDKALLLEPDFAKAWLGRGNLLTELKRHDEAFAAYDKALAQKPDLAEAWLGRGNALADLKRPEESVAAYEKALALRPQLAEAWLGCGNVLSELKRYSEAFAAYDKAVALKPDANGAAGARLFAKLLLCDWTDLEAETAKFLSSIGEDGLQTSPFALLAIPSSPADQLRCARRFAKAQPSFPKMSTGPATSHDRIRIAYVSSDLREHAIAYLTIGLFEHHDKARFETTAISFGPRRDSDFGSRIKASFDRFVDVSSRSDREIADLIRNLEVDIVIDLNGLSGHGRPGIFARRPAPIQVNHLGYSGTMGTDCYDYIIADPTVIPRQHFEFYSEQVVWLPDSFMVSDSTRQIAGTTPARGELGLPETGFVFCCFNQSYKIDPAIFDLWMRLLHRIDGSVLWLKDNDAAASLNLRREAELRGIAPERLVFAPAVARVEDHLARQRQADLFLDTLHYNAHTTANDALWAGVPVLTCIGSTFAGRVAASLVRAAGLPELVTETVADYEAVAADIAREPTLLSSLKAKLARNRDVCPLFDTARFTRHIEAAYAAMAQRAQQGAAPAHIAVPTAD
jgi:predicted O-linked N-acetylglucosamine transferase (SPINDLY family)